MKFMEVSALCDLGSSYTARILCNYIERLQILPKSHYSERDATDQSQEGMSHVQYIIGGRGMK